MAIELGELKRVSPRKIWKSESRDFTPWLSENIDKLSEILGVEMETTTTEAPVGDFSADIVARDLGTNTDVVIENQFGATDHDHLGKLLTYASGMDAGTLVWIAEEIRDEHRQALEWLNERTDSETMIFALVLEVLQIDSSAPAINLKPVVFPNKWQKRVRENRKGEVSPRNESYRKFFQDIIDELREKHKFTRAKVAQPQSWYSFRSKFKGIDYSLSFAAGEKARVELYIDTGDYDANKARFDWLSERKDLLQKEFKEIIAWERLDGKRASRIAIYKNGTIDDSGIRLQELREWMIENILKFDQIFTPILSQYKA